MQQFEASHAVEKQETRRGEIRMFFELGSEEEQQLKVRVADFNGLVRILIHPDYEKTHIRDSSKDSEEWRKKLKTVENAIQKIFASDPQKTPPVLIFEEQPQIVGFKERLQGKIKNELYLVPTYNETSTPKLTPPETPSGKEPSQSTSWEEFSKKLQALGVTKILIGGMWFIVAEKGENIPGWLKSVESEKNKKLLYCVGIAVEQLSKQFSIEISNISFPHGRKEMV
ncbi:MAG: hypothetical protein WAP51_04350 [Candidatus Sungiibacteriota bacterium]